MKIGNVHTKNNVFLAPMAGVTDMTFRVLCRRQGCGLTFTEMVSAKGLYYKSDNTRELLEMSDEEKPVAVQIFGSDPSILADMAYEIEKMGADIIDINMGCPTPKIVKNGDGSALMKNPKLVGEIVKKVVSKISVPLTVKIRKGWDDNSVNAVEIAQIAEASGASAITVHGRTREQFYNGTADWNIIKEVKRNVNIPVIGNGDIFTPQDGKRMLEETGCDAIMIGRGAQGNPWIFKRVIEYTEYGKLLPEPSIEEKIDMIVKHMNMVVEQKGENIGIKEMRKHIAWYLKGLPESSKVKGEVFKLTKHDEVEKLLISYLHRIKNKSNFIF